MWGSNHQRRADLALTSLITCSKELRGQVFPPFSKGGKLHVNLESKIKGFESNKWDSKKGENMATRESTNPKVDKKIYHNTASVTKSINLMKKRYRGGIRL